MRVSNKKRVVLYFASDNSDVAKDFAGRMRIADKVDCTLVWSNRFRDENDVRIGTGAIVIQEDCPMADVIRAAYEATSPDTEIHYMTKEGQWVTDEDETVEASDASDKESADPTVAAVQAEAETPESDIVPDVSDEPGRRIGGPIDDAAGGSSEAATVSADEGSVEPPVADASGDAEQPKD